MTEQPEASQRLFEARLAELVSARDELIGAISNQHLALTFGTASIVGVLVAGFLTWGDSANCAVFFAVPPISAWVLAMWLAEVVRMLRAVEFCREQAAVINASLGMAEIEHPPIRWEAWRDQDPGRTIRWSYVSVVAALSGAFLAGSVLGLVTANWAPCWTTVVAVAFSAAFVTLLTFVFRVYRRWRTPASKIGFPTA